ncbi:hypothetical protein [Cupriavidus plantarum]|uniref:hypothetical protein n=1 Tax=Cupriavidus plantarum TaxID=942865 RepID=UPI000E227867|nr:hypothetical protein [Cupriavidus plantarum]REE86310.1 hypothetical protein C7418_5485 [Cupriavidus plantarum]RLK29136.1 hypothetical protein C7417_5514 [Cupriavidus plantarum]
MIAKRMLGGALVVAAFAASATAFAAPATKKVGKMDVYADASRVAKADVYTDGAKRDKFDPFTDGLRQGKFDTFTDGTHTFRGDISASTLDNSRNGDLYGYRV